MTAQAAVQSGKAQARMRGSRAIDAADLLRAAQLAGGFRSTAPDTDLQVEGLHRLVESAKRHGLRDAEKTSVLRHYLARHVSAALDIERDRERFPEIADVAVREPLFIIGFGRTGSTFIHNLLALDPAARAPRLWELWSPSPPPRPEPAADASKPRIDAARHTLAYFEKTSPAILQIHNMDALGPDECHHVMSHSTHLAMLYNAPEYWEWLKQLDDSRLRALFLHYRRQVQHFQRHSQGRHWVSKSLAHLHFFPVLFDVFPGAKIVRLHRDPLTLVPSLCSLYASLRKLFETSVDAASVGEIVTDVFVDGMERMMRADAVHPPECFIDVMFDELISDPTGVVRRVYQRCGYSYSVEFDRALCAYVANPAAVDKSRHRYSLEDFGLSRNMVAARVANYAAWLKDRVATRAAP